MLTRRHFLHALGLGTATAVVAPELLVPEPEPVRRYWQVPSGAPVAVRDPGGALREAILRHIDEHARAFAEHAARQREIAMLYGGAQRPGKSPLGDACSHISRTIAGRMDIAERLRGRNADYTVVDEASYLRGLRDAVLGYESKTRKELAALYPEPDPAAPFRMTVLKPREPMPEWFRQAVVERKPREVWMATKLREVGDDPYSLSRSPVVAVRTGGLFSALTTEHADGSFVVHMPGAEDA